MALGVVSAVFKAHKKGVYVIGVDGDLNSLKSELKGVKHGGQAASVAQSPFTMGALGVEACIAAVNGKVLPSFVASPTFVVTQANAATAIARWPAPPVTSKDPLAGLL
jgi:ribose transport system substrate-binding protein